MAIQNTMKQKQLKKVVNGTIRNMKYKSNHNGDAQKQQPLNRAQRSRKIKEGLRRSNKKK